MNLRTNIYTIVIVIFTIGWFTACTDDVSEQDRRAQEQRFFDLYVGGHYPDVQPLSSGIYYIEHKAGTGNSPDADDWMLVNHVSYTIPEDNIYESYIEDVAIDNRFYEEGVMYGPYKMLNGSVTEGLQEGMMLMKEGGQATIFFTSDLGYGVNGTGDVSPYTSLKYEIELLEVIPDIEAYEQARIAAYVDTIPTADTIYHPETDSYMYYMIDQATTGDPVVNDSLVDVAYKGYLMDGRVFDERTADDPLSITVGKESITGWDLGLLRLKEGEKARFVIPYPLAYGESGREVPNTGLRAIPPYETLLFDIEILSIEEGVESVDPGD